MQRSERMIHKERGGKCGWASTSSLWPKGRRAGQGGGVWGGMTTLCRTIHNSVSVMIVHPRACNTFYTSMLTCASSAGLHQTGIVRVCAPVDVGG